ncbi:MAG: serine/threonine-protein kinase [Myxococcota bacterium]
MRARTQEPELVGHRVGEFDVRDRVARGPATSVYRAVQPDAGDRLVALKVMDRVEDRLRARDGDLANPLWREASLSQSVRDPGIVRIFKTGRLPDGRPYVAMEYVEGPTLRERLRDGPLPWREAATLMRQVSATVARLHGAGVVHGDLKPSNLLLRPLSDGGVRVKLIDFGRARAPGRVATVDHREEDAEGGTPQYMPPEEAAGGATSRPGDVYALGAVLYEMLTGKPAIALKRPSPEACLAWLRSDRPLPSIPVHTLAPDIPVPMARFVYRCLSRDPADRPQDGSAMLDGLEDAVALSRPVGEEDGNDGGPGRLGRLWRSIRSALGRGG